MTISRCPFFKALHHDPFNLTGIKCGNIGFSYFCLIYCIHHGFCDITAWLNKLSGCVLQMRNKFDDPLHTMKRQNISKDSALIPLAESTVSPKFLEGERSGESGRS